MTSKISETVETPVEDDTFDIRETYVAQSDALAAVWDDPESDVYNDYDAHRPSID